MPITAFGRPEFDEVCGTRWDDPFGLPADSPVALASQVLQPDFVEYDDATASVADQSGVLEPACDERHRGPTRAQHLCDGFLRQGEVARIPSAIECLHQPARQAGFEGMKGIAGGGLLHLAEQGFLIS